MTTTATADQLKRSQSITQASTLAATALMGGLQWRRLQKRTNSWLDKPSPLWWLASAYGVVVAGNLAQEHFTQSRPVSGSEIAANRWLREIPLPVRVAALIPPARIARFEGERVLLVNEDFLKLSQADQRACYGQAVKQDTTQWLTTAAVMVGSATVERLLWRAVVGKRSKLSRSRATVFAATELARVASARAIRAELNRRGVR